MVGRSVCRIGRVDRRQQLVSGQGGELPTDLHGGGAGEVGARSVRTDPNSCWHGCWHSCQFSYACSVRCVEGNWRVKGSWFPFGREENTGVGMCVRLCQHPAKLGVC